jgi:lipoyl(octanoyl) transferase
MGRVFLHDLGTVPYDAALGLQRETVAGLQAGAPDEALYFLEHPHVVTRGRNASLSTLLANEELLARKGVILVETDRGGDVTYHGPGQLVGYPILRLEEGRRDIRRYVNDVEEVLIRALAGLSIEARRHPKHRGVWVGPRKIASLGIRISRWVTSHGFALNVSTDLSYFSLIVPCGIEGCTMTSIERELGRPVEMCAVKEIVARSFADVFGREVVPANDSAAVPRTAATGELARSTATAAALPSEEKEARSA